MKYTTIAIAIILAASAGAQWTVVFVPSGGFSGVSGGRMVGPWNGAAGVYSAGSWTSLHPVGWLNSAGDDISGTQQVGHVDDGVLGHACLWTLTPESFTDLHPTQHPNAVDSILIGTSGDQQVGWVRFDGAPYYHASLWSGTAASWIDLHPVWAGALHSLANDVDGGEQVGTTNFSNRRVAGLWRGTAASWEELNPPWGVESFGMGVGDGQQVGRAWDGTTERAVLWRGTAASCVDLHPVGVGATSSLATAVDGGVQVGEVGFATGARASLWYGTSGSYVDLHSFIPGQGVWSSVADISQDGSFTRVVGHSEGGATIWIARMIAPTTYTPVRGIFTGGNLASLLNSDDNRLVMRPGIVFATGEPPVQIRVDATAPAAFPNGIAFSVESSATFGNAQQKIWLWNYVIGDYELVDTRLATLTDDVTNVIVRTNSSRFIQPGTLAIRALVSFRAIGPAFAYPWSARIDKLWWTFPG